MSLLLSIDGTDRRTDGRTPDRYIDPVPRTSQAESIMGTKITLHFMYLFLNYYYYYYYVIFYSSECFITLKTIDDNPQQSSTNAVFEQFSEA